MNRNSNGMSTGMALLCTLEILLLIGWLIDLGTPKCITLAIKQHNLCYEFVVVSDIMDVWKK